MSSGIDSGDVLPLTLSRDYITVLEDGQTSHERVDGDPLHLVSIVGGSAACGYHVLVPDCPLLLHVDYD